MFHIFQYDQCHNQGKEQKANYQIESLFSVPGVSLISNGVIVIVNTLKSTMRTRIYLNCEFQSISFSVHTSMFVLSINYEMYDSFLKVFIDAFCTNGLPRLDKVIPDNFDIIEEFMIINHAIIATHKTGRLEFFSYRAFYYSVSLVVMDLFRLLFSSWFDFGNFDKSRNEPDFLAERNAGF